MSDPRSPSTGGLAGSRRVAAYVLLLAVMGCVAAASWAGLYAYARVTLGWTPAHAVLVPVALDVAAMTCALLALDSIAKGETAPGFRVLTAAFVALSAFINWQRAITTGKLAEQVFFPAMSVLAYLLVHEVFAKYRREVTRDLATGKVHREQVAPLPRLGLLAWLPLVGSPARALGAVHRAVLDRIPADARPADSRTDSRIPAAAPLSSSAARPAIEQAPRPGGALADSLTDSVSDARGPAPSDSLTDSRTDAPRPAAPRPGDSRTDSLADSRTDAPRPAEPRPGDSRTDAPADSRTDAPRPAEPRPGDSRTDAPADSLTDSRTDAPRPAAPRLSDSLAAAPSDSRTAAPSPARPRRKQAAPAGTLADAIRAGIAEVGDKPSDVTAWLAEHGRPGVPTSRVHDVIRRAGPLPVVPSAASPSPLRAVGG